ncbi:MAG TPA: hypothetical protein VKT49_00775 [Bryobacteraceae bacterium]|nr:hypothetical protein [Bryobacteraceae bacterium]
MRLLISWALFSAAAAAAELPYFAVLSDDPGAWPPILSSIGLQPQPAGRARVFVARAGAAASVEWVGRVEGGATLILEGESSLAELFGFRPTKQMVRVTSVADVHQPNLGIVWEKALDLPLFTVPEGARVFARERWSAAPLIAGLRKGAGAVLWVAMAPGEGGYERFPYILPALRDLGLEPPFRSARLWAFFDSAYRSRVDLEYFAPRWRKAGIAALHVAAWHFYESDPQNDAWLAQLIRICHREGILVYAWLELPHVSERFWAEHPEWREKTAALQDAHLDWRKLMNLTNRNCFHAVAAGVGELVRRFDWDGVNLAELYFESLEGISNPSRFTPMNDDVRAAFRSVKGFDPLELFSNRADPASRQTFLDFRAGLVRGMQEEWLGVLESSRRTKPNLDLVLTHVDDRLDSGMRDAVGADAAGVLPLLDRHAFTFLIEDPATVWHLGPKRYRALSDRYQALTGRREKLAIDLNIVERYQNVYPTKQQTGTELLQLVHEASQRFPRVALYFESSLFPVDWDLLSSAAATVSRVERLGQGITVDSLAGVALPWKGGATVDGQAWPVRDESFLWLPPGLHSVQPAAEISGLRLLRLNGDLKTARFLNAGGIEFSYQNSSRAIATFDRPLARIEIDGVGQAISFAGPASVLLPRGQHVITAFAE